MHGIAYGLWTCEANIINHIQYYNDIIMVTQCCCCFLIVGIITIHSKKKYCLLKRLKTLESDDENKIHVGDNGAQYMI